MGDRGNIVLVPHGAIPDRDFLEIDPDTVWLYTHWGGKDLLQQVKEAIQKLGSKRAKDPQEWVKLLTNEGFEQTEGPVRPDHPDIFVMPERERITYGFPLAEPEGDEIIPELSFKELREMPDKMVAIVDNAMSDKEMMEWYSQRYDESIPYRIARNADERSSLLVAGIPLLLAGLGGAAAYFQNRNAGQ